jgi:hypothetical protein
MAVKLMTDLAPNLSGASAPKAVASIAVGASSLRDGSSRKRVHKAVATNMEVTTPRTRSRVTNGSAVLLAGTMHKRMARRFRDVLAAIVSDLGGVGAITEGKRQLARRAALMSVQCEELETRALAQGEDIDLDQYGQLSDRIGRCFQRLGLKRVTRDTTPSLAQLVAAHKTAKPVEKPAECAKPLAATPPVADAFPSPATDRATPVVEPIEELV